MEKKVTDTKEEEVQKEGISNDANFLMMMIMMRIITKGIMKMNRKR